MVCESAVKANYRTRNRPKKAIMAKKECEALRKGHHDEITSIRYRCEVMMVTKKFRKGSEQLVCKLGRVEQRRFVALKY